MVCFNDDEQNNSRQSAVDATIHSYVGLGYVQLYLRIFLPSYEYYLVHEYRQKFTRYI